MTFIYILYLSLFTLYLSFNQQNAKVELYKIGKQLRKRYKDLLGPYYKPDVGTW